MDNNHSDKKYESFKIPKHSKKEENGSFYSPSQVNNTAENLMQDDIFYEIEYDSCPLPGVGKYVMRSAKIEPPPKDEIREKFNQMRDIARSNRSFYLSSSKFYDSKVQREKAKIFYEQGMFMKDFEDDYDKIVTYSSYFPFYQMMGYEQLRTYFTWRTKVRKGIVNETSLSYAFLYIYELLNNIGVDDPEDGLDKLMFFWKEFRVHDQTISKYVLKWLKDYHIYYNLPQSFKVFIMQNNLGAHYPQIEKSGDDFDLLCSISKYDIRKSVFYTEDNAELIKNCFYYTTGKLKQVFEEIGVDYDGAIFQPVKNMTVWTPFKDALFYPWLRQQDRRVVLSESEFYVCNQNTWKFNKVITTESGRKFLGYVMKQMEVVLRKVTKYKYTITASISAVNPVTVSILMAVGISLEELITNAVKEFYREATKTIVRVEQSALDKIRQEALITQEKLIVEEDAVEPNTVKMLVKQMPMEQNMVKRMSVEYNQSEQTSVGQTLVEKLSFEPWTEFKTALNHAELEAMVLILHGETGTPLKQFADNQGIMLEVLIDGINEKAMDYIGDSILDDEFAIYEDYIEEVKEMVSDI